MRRSSTGRLRIFLTTDAVGGVWTYTVTLARGLAARGLDVRVAVMGPEPDPAQRQRLVGPGLDMVCTACPLDWLAGAPGDIDEAAAALRTRALEWRADLVHLHAPALAGSRTWPLPTVVSMHSCVATWWQAVYGTSVPPGMAWRTRATAAGLAIADVVIAPTAAFAAAVEECYGDPPRLEVIHNGAEPFTGADDTAPRRGILAAGRLWDGAKNLATLDAAAGLIEHPVHAAGECRAPDGTRVTFAHIEPLGRLGTEVLQARMARTAVFASPAIYEPFGLAVLEAARRGAALVLSDIPTFRELWAGAARFVPAMDTRALAAALEKFSANDELRGVYAERARARAARFTSEGSVAATLDVYDRVLARSRVPERLASG